MNYRERCYKTYITTKWQYTHSLSKGEYDFFSKIAKKKFKNRLPANKNSKILDIACGAGHFLYFLQNEGYVNSFGIDNSQEQLDVAKKMGVKNLSKVDLFQYLPEHLQSFDMIIANDIIEHLNKEEVLGFLDAIYNSLSPSGCTLMSTVNAQSLFGNMVIYCDFTHELAFTPKSLSQIMRVCTYEDVMVYGEKPVVHDFRSAARAGLWWCTKKILSSYLKIERGTGRNFWKMDNILEPRIYVVGRKPDAK